MNAAVRRASRVSWPLVLVVTSVCALAVLLSLPYVPHHPKLSPEEVQQIQDDQIAEVDLVALYDIVEEYAATHGGRVPDLDSRELPKWAVEALDPLETSRLGKGGPWYYRVPHLVAGEQFTSLSPGTTIVETVPTARHCPVLGITAGQAIKRRKGWERPMLGA